MIQYRNTVPQKIQTKEFLTLWRTGGLVVEDSPAAIYVGKEGKCSLAAKGYSPKSGEVFTTFLELPADFALGNERLKVVADNPSCSISFEPYVNDFWEVKDTKNGGTMYY